MPGYIHVPEGVHLQLDETKIKSGDPEQLWEALHDFYIALKDHLEDMAGVVNLDPEYDENSSSPTPADGKFTVWKDTSVSPPKYRLVYGDGGGQVMIPDASETEKGLVERATSAEAAAGTDNERYITPAQLAASSDSLRLSMYIRVTDHKSSGTTGGTTVATTWTRRDLNTEENDEPAIASVSSNQISLPAGKYYVKAMAPFAYCGGVRLRLYNETDGAVLLYGQNDWTYNGSYASFTKAVVTGFFTLTGTKNVSLQYYAAAAQGNALGPALSLGVDEVYSVVEIWRVG